VVGWGWIRVWDERIDDEWGDTVARVVTKPHITVFRQPQSPQEGTPLETQLLSAIAAKDDGAVLPLIGLMQTESSTPAPATSDRAGGTWRLVWSQQAENASPLQVRAARRCGGVVLLRVTDRRASAWLYKLLLALALAHTLGTQSTTPTNRIIPPTSNPTQPNPTHQKWGSQQAKSYQIIDAAAGTLENVVDLGAAQIRAQATCSAASDSRTDVNISGAFLKTGPIRVPLPVSGTGFVDWLYLSEGVRVTRGSKGSLFVHVKEGDDVEV